MVFVDDYGTFFGIVTLPYPASPEIPNPSKLRQRKLASIISSITFVGIASWPVAGHALGFGALGGEAIIGEALRLTIPLTGLNDGPIGGECVSVRRATDPVDPEYFPRDLAASVEQTSGTTRIVLTSRSAIRQPLVEFRISVSCGYNLSHDYLVMATPRNAAAANATPGISTKTASAPPVPAATPAVATSVVAAPRLAATRLPDGLAGRNLVLDDDLTLEQLAQRNFPGPLRQQRFMRWVVEANPHLFAGATKLRQHVLKRGTSLTLPDGVPPRRRGDHQGNVTPLGERIDTAGAEAVPPAPRAASSGSSGATRTAGGGRKDQLVIGGGGSARNLKEAVAIVDQLTGMMEKQLAAQTAYNEKIKGLEASVEDLGKQIKGLEADAAKREAAWQAERQAEKSAREQAAEREWWKLLAAVVAGGVVGAAALLGLRNLFGRRRSMAEDLADLPIEAITPPPAPPAPESPTIAPEVPKPAPLTQFGWDDDDHHPQPVAVAPPPPGATPSAQRMPAIEARPEPRTRAPAHPPIEFELPTTLEAGKANTGTGPSDPATAAIELANIMTSMGLAESAAQTLVEHIRENPRESLPQWLKLLEIHRLNGNRVEFERSASELRQHFNVQAEDWSANAAQGRTSLEAYPHIRAQVVKLWRTPDCANLLRALLLDNREGTRLGFPLAVAEEILLLVAILNSAS